MVLWQNAMGIFSYALVIQFEEFFDAAFYSVSIVQRDRINTLTLYHKDFNKTWRVLRAS